VRPYAKEANFIFPDGGGLAEKAKEDDGREAWEPVQYETVPDSQKAGDDAVPSRAVGRMSQKAGSNQMETGCLHRKVGTGRQTQDIKSPSEYRWHSTAIRCHDRYDLMNTPFDSCRLKEWLESFFPTRFFSITRVAGWEATFKVHLKEPLRVSSI